jgi:hypothetical protein
MPKGPRGEKRPADVIGNAVKVMRIATGEETEQLDTDRAKSAAVELGRRDVRNRAEKAISRTVSYYCQEGRFGKMERKGLMSVKTM